MSIMLLSWSSVGCARWKVVKSAAPNPFIGHKQFKVEPVDFSEVVAAKNGAPKFEKDKLAFSKVYATSLREEADGYQWSTEDNADTVTIRSKAMSLDGGISLGITSTNATAHMIVQLVKGGEVLDEISVKAKASQEDKVKVFGISTGGYTAAARIKDVAKKLGDYVAGYLESRTDP